MPLLNVPPEVDAMVAAGSYEQHSTIDIILGSGQILHLATDGLTDIDTIDFGTVDYQSWLREVGTMSESITLSRNEVRMTAQNVDHEMGSRVIEDPEEELNGCNAIHSYVFINDDCEKFQVEILHGRIVSASDEDPNMSFSLVSHLSTDGVVGGNRTLQNRCSERYKIGPGCATQSPLEQGCSKNPDGPNGCSEHLPAPRIVDPVEEDNRSSFTGFLYQIGKLPGTPPTGPTGVFDGGDDFNSHFAKREQLGGYTGRHTIPEIF